jgi:DNA-binding MarR family transcriptional regulator
LIRVLTKHQIFILNELYENGHYITVTNLIKNLSSRYKIPPSTLRWNAKKLYELELIECGTYQNKGKPVRLTDYGHFIYEILNKNI